MINYKKSYCKFNFFHFFNFKKISYSDCVFLIIFLNITFLFNTHAQFQKKEPLVTADGYLKNMGTVMTSNDLDIIRYDNLVHNRINTHWHFSDKIDGELDLRTRIFNGYSVQNISDYDEQVDQDFGLVDLSFNPLNENRILINTTIDRLYVNIMQSNWKLTIGRQRINWGQALVWNPNDLFNNYSFFNFDYEKRPGADALRFEYFTDFASGFEIAVNPGDSVNGSVAAFKWKENVLQYDIQAIFAHYNKDVALGMGWSGNIKGAGFKGEITYFRPKDEITKDEGSIAGVISSDYSFKNGLYIHSEALYNGFWESKNRPGLLFRSRLSAKNLFPADVALFGEMRYPIHPLVDLGFASIYGPTENLYSFIPRINISVISNLELLCMAQIFRYNKLESIIDTPNFIFGRLKWSF